MTGIRVDIEGSEGLEKALGQLVSEHTKSARKERRRRSIKLLGLSILMILGVSYAVWIWLQAQGKTFFPTDAHAAVIPVRGPIGGTGPSQQAENINGLIERAFGNSSTRAVILHINSSGGSPSVADRVGRFARSRADKTQKPLIAHIDGVGTSAAYMIAIQADEIYMSSYSLTGSVGSIMAGLKWTDLASRVGVDQQVFVSSPLKNAMSPWSEDGPQSQRLLQGLVDQSANTFTAQVVEARGDRLDLTAEELSRAKVYMAPEAFDLGLVDGVATLDELARETLSLPIYRMEHRRNLYEQLLVTAMGQFELVMNRRSGFQ